MIANITAAAASTIDAELAELGAAKAKAAARLTNIEVAIARNEERIASGKAGAYEASRMADANVAAAALIPALVAELDEISAAERPLNAEYTRRGGWTRAFLVANSNGHVHSSTSCASCYVSTSFYWVTDLSDAAEAEIVDAAGDSACTICYPSAPVALDPTYRKASTIEEPAKREARIARETAKAARAAKAAASAIFAVDGSPLRSTYGVLRTEQSAQNELVGNIVNTRAYGYRSHDELNARIVAALAAKRGQSVAEIEAAIELKVAAKIKREAAEAARRGF